MKGGVRGFIYVPSYGAAAHMGLWMFTGGSNSSYLKQIVQSSVISVSNNGGSFSFTNSTNDTRTIYFISVGAYGNLPDD